MTATKPAKRTWAEYEFPDWIPKSVRVRLREFWADEIHRGPDEWLENIRSPYNHHPDLGALVECESMTQERRPLIRGRWVPMWNNIGRVIKADGTVGISSTCGIRVIELPRRLQRKRVAGWRKPEGAIIVDRTSTFGNPFPVAKYGLADSKAFYIEWLDGSDRWPELNELREKVMRRLPELRDKNLICFCPEDAEWCHAMELIKRANL